MARPFNAYTRPGLPNHRSYHGHEDTSRRNIGGEAPPASSYESYEITPRDLPLDENRGRWYRAKTERMPLNERDLQQFVQKQSSSDYTVGHAFYDRKMQGSKRKHIYDFIADKTASNPDWIYELKFLKLDRNHKQRGSKKPRQKTLSIHIILERKLRPRNKSDPLLPRTMSTHGFNRTDGNLAATNHLPDIPIPGTVTAPVNMTRPQYIPLQTREGYPHGQNIPPRLPIVDNRNSRGQLFPPGKRPPDSDESSSLRPASPSSTLSSDTAESSSRRASYSSSPTTAAFGSLSRNTDHYIQGSNRVVLDRVVQRSYVHRGTQTDTTLNASQSCRPAVARLTSVRPREESAVQAWTGTFRFNAHEREGVPKAEGADCSTDVQNDDQETPKLENSHQDTSVTFEKPAWMNNMQPAYGQEVLTPVAIKENVDPFTKAADQSPTNQHAKDSVADPPTKGRTPTSKEPIKRSEDEKIKPNPFDHVFKQVRDTSSPDISPMISTAPIAASSTPIRKDITISEYFSGLPNANRLPMAGYIPPPPPPLPQTTPPQPRRYSDELSQRQSRAKSVRFDLSAHPKTVPSTPTMGTPPSSPDPTTSSSSSDFVPTPKTPAGSPHASSPISTPHRPSLQRSSHTTTIDSHPRGPQLLQPPRSSSYRDLPPSHPNTEERDWWSTVPSANVNRRQSVNAQNPVIRPYECKFDQCRSSGFASRDALSQHMRTTHEREHKGSI